MFDCLEMLRNNDSVKMNIEGYFFATDTCTCTVSAAGVKLITFESFDKFEFPFFVALSIQLKQLLEHYVRRKR